MNTLAKTVLSSALLTIVIAGTSANAGRAELSSHSDNYVVKTAQKVFLGNTSGGDAEQVIACSENLAAIKKVSFNIPSAVNAQEINR